MSVQSAVETIPLRSSTLGQLSAAVAVPAYDRSATVPGIVHIGVGGFNRSHLAVYLDDLLAHGGPKHWAELGIGLLPGDQSMHAALAEQDFLYGVLERDTDVQNYRVIGSLVGHLYAPQNPEAVLASMTAVECEIISLTVTEGGYFRDDSTGAFLANDPAIQHDLLHPTHPATWLGFVAEVASRRMKQGLPPFTLLSCDNLQANGDTARKALLAFADLRGGDVSAWIESGVTFPNCMVDRITPRTTDEDRATIASAFGVRDLAPVVTEPFRQWVLEDTFATGRPAWEKVGVEMTRDVAPYEKTKMRLLNGGHFCIAYCAALLGIQYVADAVADPQLRELLAQFLAEVRTTLHDLPGINLDDYAATIVRRFSNPSIRDQIARICSDGTAKVTKFIVPSLTDLLAAQTSPRILPFVIASWLHYQRGMAEDCQPYMIADPGVGILTAFVASGCSEASQALALRSLFSDLAARFPSFAATVQHDLDNFRQLGVRGTLANALVQCSDRRPL